MRNVYYTYHVSRSDNPDIEKSMETIEDVQRYTKLSVLSIYKNMLHEGNVKGWTVSRTPLPKNKKEKSPTRRGVIVRKSNGYISRFGSQKSCARCLGVSESTVAKSLKHGIHDYKGNWYEYDYMY